jgi:hypothetical protein
MLERNDKGREIWFSRVMWSYMPAHWKGVVYPSAVIAITVPLFLWAAEYSRSLAIIPLVLAWAFVMWMCERHSPSRR